jgi:hypothetical protein
VVQTVGPFGLHVRDRRLELEHLALHLHLALNLERHELRRGEHERGCLPWRTARDQERAAVVRGRGPN